ncbi:hypothetical protein ACH35V_31335 [Actinomadura sp. 1N219]|uniref:hypothetical protein n=1 Tax=Actinomadura sp. 1N219 TaxID=3375152 RepID=UPI0037B8AE18
MNHSQQGPYGPRHVPPQPLPAFAVPPQKQRGTRLKAIELHDSMFSGGVTVPLGDR